MPMGLCGALSMFQFLMDNTFTNPNVLDNGLTVDLISLSKSTSMKFASSRLRKKSMSCISALSYSV